MHRLNLRSRSSHVNININSHKHCFTVRILDTLEENAISCPVGGQNNVWLFGSFQFIDSSECKVYL